MQTFEISPGRVTAANGRMHLRPTPRQVVPNQKPHPGPRGWSVAWNEPYRTAQYGSFTVDYNCL